MRRIVYGGLVLTALFVAALHFWVDVWLESTWIADTGRALRSQWNRIGTATVDYRSFAPVRALVERDIEAELRRRGIAPGDAKERDARWDIEEKLSQRFLSAASESDRLAMFKYAVNESRFSWEDPARVSPLSWVMLKVQAGDAHPLTRYAEGTVLLQLMGAARQSTDWHRPDNFLRDRARIPPFLERLRATPGATPDTAARHRICEVLLSIPMFNFEVDFLLRRLEPLDAEARVAEPVLAALAAHDATSAVELIRGAADDGCLDAQVAMGDLHAEGLFLPYDPDAADRWYLSAGASGYPAKRAERDPARTPVATFRAPLEEAPFGTLRFSSDETEVVAASSTRIARFAVPDPSRARVFPTLPIVTLSETGAMAITRTDTDLVLLDARHGAVTGTIEIPACLRPGSLQGRFHEDGESAWVMTADEGCRWDRMGTFSGALINVTERRITSLREEFLRATGSVRFAIRPDLAEVGILRDLGRTKAVELFSPASGDGMNPEENARHFPLGDAVKSLPEFRSFQALDDGVFFSNLFVRSKGRPDFCGWILFDPRRRVILQDRRIDRYEGSSRFAVPRSDGKWAFFEGSAKGYDGGNYLRDLATLRVVGAFPHPRLGVKSAAFSRSGRFLATTDGHLVKVWDLTRLEGYTLPAPR